MEKHLKTVLLDSVMTLPVKFLHGEKKDEKVDANDILF